MAVHLKPQDLVLALKLVALGRAEWTQPGDIPFLIPEHEAWLIAERAWDEGDAWPCFAPGLATKMTDFTSSLV